MTSSLSKLNTNPILDSKVQEINFNKQECIGIRDDMFPIVKLDRLFLLNQVIPYWVKLIISTWENGEDMNNLEIDEEANIITVLMKDQALNCLLSKQNLLKKVNQTNLSNILKYGKKILTEVMSKKLPQTNIFEMSEQFSIVKEIQSREASVIELKKN